MAHAEEPPQPAKTPWHFSTWTMGNNIAIGLCYCGCGCRAEYSKCLGATLQRENKNSAALVQKMTKPAVLYVSAAINQLRTLRMRFPRPGTVAAMAPTDIPLDTDTNHRLRTNERIWAGFREIEIRMLGAETLPAVVEVLTRDLPKLFPGVQAVSISWLDPDREMTRLLEQHADKTLISSLIALSVPMIAQLPTAPHLGQLDATRRHALFPGAAPDLRSMALVPFVVRGQQVGTLNQASIDPEHFLPDAATDLLEHLAAVAALCIDAAVYRARLQRDGLTDTLTQVANRRFFDRRLREEISQWSRRKEPVSCLLVDLDHFKQINDQHGHQTGDRVLHTVATTLNQGLRTSDVLARYGGEEFVLLLPATSSERALEIAERLRSAVAGLALTTTQGTRLRVTASFGVASLRGDQHKTLDDPGSWLVSHADQALYKAKSHGRNCVMTNGEVPTTTSQQTQISDGTSSALETTK